MLACSHTEVSTGIRDLLQPQIPALAQEKKKPASRARFSRPATVTFQDLLRLILVSTTSKEAIVGIKHAASVMSPTVEKLRPRAGYSRPPIGVLLGDAAYKLGGERAETCVRRAIADVLAANTILRENGIRGVLRTERVSVGIVLFSAVVESSDSETSNFMRKQLPSFVEGFASKLLSDAMKAAAEKGIAHQITPEHVSAAWPEPCEALFEYFAERNAKALTTWLCDNNLNSGTRARAASSVRLVKDHNLARELLRPLVEGAEVPLVVREAAVYALDPHLDLETENNLRRMAYESGTHRIVREAVKDLVDVA